MLKSRQTNAQVQTCFHRDRLTKSCFSSKNRCSTSSVCRHARNASQMCFCVQRSTQAAFRRLGTQKPEAIVNPKNKSRVPLAATTKVNLALPYHMKSIPSRRTYLDLRQMSNFALSIALGGSPYPATFRSRAQDRGSYTKILTKTTHVTLQPLQGATRSPLSFPVFTFRLLRRTTLVPMDFQEAAEKHHETNSEEIGITVTNNLSSNKK